MKHTIIAGMLLILILLVVVMNATFVRSVTDELYTRLNELPVSKGGTHARDNLMSLCQSCHTKIQHDLGDR